MGFAATGCSIRVVVVDVVGAPAEAKHASRGGVISADGAGFILLIALPVPNAVIFCADGVL